MTQAEPVVRVAHVVSHPVQYFAPLYRAIEQRPELDFTVHFCSDASLRTYHDPGFGVPVAWDVDLASGYRYVLAPSACGRPLGRVRRRPQLDLLRAICTGRYDVVWIHGYTYPNAWLATVLARLAGARVLLREEATLLRRRSYARRAIKRFLLSPLFRLVRGLYIGEQNRRFFEHYGVAPDRLFPVPYCVDNDDLQSRGAALRPRREELRRSFGIDDDAPVLLFVGKLVAVKDPFVALAAFARLRAQVRCWFLVVGDGELAEEFDRKVAELAVPNVVRTGFLNQSKLPEAYSAADLFVLPSSFEPWGLVVNEALNFGLPVVAARTVGCAEDLVRDGVNGFTFGVGDADALEAHLRVLVSDPDLRVRLGDRGREIVGAYSIDRAADGVVRACLDRRVRR